MTTVPEGMSALTSSLVVSDAKSTIEAYKTALGAQVLGILNCPTTGKVLHCAMTVEGSTLFIYDEKPEMGMMPTGRQNFYLYVDNADSATEKAKAAGWQEASAPQDMFWGDRMSVVIDQNGNTWNFAHRVKEVSPEEMQAAVEEMAKA